MFRCLRGRLELWRSLLGPLAGLGSPWRQPAAPAPSPAELLLYDSGPVLSWTSYSPGDNDAPPPDLEREADCPISDANWPRIGSWPGSTQTTTFVIPEG